MIFAAVLLIVCGLVCVGIWQIQREKDPVHREQQKALKRHNRLIHGYWAKRAEQIKRNIGRVAL